MKKNDVLPGGLLAVVLLGAGLVVMAVMAAVLLGGSGDSGGSTNPPDTFTVVRNDCGLCGTNSPVGGWESEDGRALILDADGSFIALFGDGTSMSGAWEQDSSELCLSPAVGGEVCNSYRQLVDAMKWGDAVYIRR